MIKYVCMTSDGEELNIKAEEHLFIEEMIDKAGRDDLMVVSVSGSVEL